jgi:hypothetical protein
MVHPSTQYACPVWEKPTHTEFGSTLAHTVESVLQSATHRPFPGPPPSRALDSDGKQTTPGTPQSAEAPHALPMGAPAVAAPPKPVVPAPPNGDPPPPNGDPPPPVGGAPPTDVLPPLPPSCGEATVPPQSQSPQSPVSLQSWPPSHLPGPTHTRVIPGSHRAPALVPPVPVGKPLSDVDPQAPALANAASIAAKAKGRESVLAAACFSTRGLPAHVPIRTVYVTGLHPGIHYRSGSGTRCTWSRLCSAGTPMRSGKP